MSLLHFENEQWVVLQDKKRTVNFDEYESIVTAGDHKLTMDKIKELNDDANEQDPEREKTNTKITASKFKSVSGSTAVKPKSIAASASRASKIPSQTPQKYVS